MQVRPFPKVFLYAALPCEAKPLIDAYKLKKDTPLQPFGIFRNEEIILTVTGIGKTAMAAGVAYTQALFPANPNPVLINIGIAGHRIHPVGSLFLADKITEADTGRHYYPPLVFTSPCPTANLMTFAKPRDAYPDSALCDMEASSFYECATRFSTGELCHCVKAVSDNAAFPAGQIQAQAVSELIRDNMAAISRILEELTRLAGALPKANGKGLFELINQCYRFSVSEQIQLHKLLNRWRVISNHESIDLDAIPAKTGQEFLELLNQQLNTMEFTL